LALVFIDNKAGKQFVSGFVFLKIFPTDFSVGTGRSNYLKSVYFTAWHSFINRFITSGVRNSSLFE
jgi:hypothetical protein